MRFELPRQKGSCQHHHYQDINIVTILITFKIFIIDIITTFLILITIFIVNIFAFEVVEEEVFRPWMYLLRVEIFKL